MTDHTLMDRYEKPLQVSAEAAQEIFYLRGRIVLLEEELAELKGDGQLIHLLANYFNDTLPQIGRLAIQDYGALNDIAIELRKRGLLKD